MNLADDERDAEDGDERLDQYARGYGPQSPSWSAATRGTRKPASRWLHLAWTIPLAWMVSGVPIAFIVFAWSSFGGRQVAAGVAALLLVGAISLGAMLLTLLVAISTV